METFNLKPEELKMLRYIKEKEILSIRSKKELDKYIYIYDEVVLFKTTLGRILEDEKYYIRRLFDNGFLPNITNNLSPIGSVLNIHPHGCVFIYGNLYSMSRLVTNVENNCSSHLLSIDDLLNSHNTREFISNEFKENKIDDSGLSRINFILKHFIFPKYSYILVIKEKWDTVNITIPGGKRMFGETTKDCAKREFYEETGIKIDKIGSYINNSISKMNFYPYHHNLHKPVDYKHYFKPH